MSLKAMATAFRMAERDMKAAFNNPRSRSAGPYRTVFGARMHCRLSKKKLSALMALLFGLTGSLWAPMVVHAVMDITGGRIAHAAANDNTPDRSSPELAA